MMKEKKEREERKGKKERERKKGKERKGKEKVGIGMSGWAMREAASHYSPTEGFGTTFGAADVWSSLTFVVVH